MKGLRIAAVGVVLMILALVMAYQLVIKIEIGHVGVKTNEWGSEQGLVEKDFMPGYHWDLGPMHRWAVFDSTVQTLNMTGELRDALVVKSSDGANVTLDVTVKYRIEPGNVWQLRRDQGENEASYKTKVRNLAINSLRPILGNMKAEHFYNPILRKKMATDSEERLRISLRSIYVELVVILFRDVSFDESYERRIKEKELAKQEAEVNRSKKLAAEKAGITNKIMAETEAKLAVIEETREKTMRELTAENEKTIAAIEVDADRYVTETMADADLYAAQKLADADLLIRNADAKGEHLRKTALQGPGATNLIAIEAAENLTFGTLVISTLENNILDLKSIAEKLGAKGGK